MSAMKRRKRKMQEPTTNTFAWRRQGPTATATAKINAKCYYFKNPVTLSTEATHGEGDGTGVAQLVGSV